MIDSIARIFLAVSVTVCLTGSAFAAAEPFSNWAAVVVAGDNQDSNGGPTEGFDNARRDVAKNLLAIGFLPANLAQFSTRPRRYRHEKLHATSPSNILRVLEKLTATAHDGCFLYFSSHGEPDGLIVGNWVVPPRALAQIVDQTCGPKPTAVIISACFSGAMLPALEGQNRLILTAARRDRTSFGCGQSDHYPYFDQCILESWNGVSDFAELGRKAQACVAAREQREHLHPHSDPQLWIGPLAKSSLPKW